VTLDKAGENPLDSIYYRGRVVVTEVEITLALLDSIYYKGRVVVTEVEITLALLDSIYLEEELL